MPAQVEIREAREGDIAAIRALLADDALGRMREDLSEDGLARYRAAFARIAASPDNTLYVAELAGAVAGVFQLTFIPYLSRGGNTRSLIEGVRVASTLRGRGIGRQMMLFAIEASRMRGCALVQLTSDKTRAEAHRFYHSLGFVATHEGMKLAL